MCQCNGKDQTPKSVAKFTNENEIDAFSEKSVGIGMFVIPAPDLGILETKVVLVDNLSFLECTKRGSNCESFKWIPRGYSFIHGVKKNEVTINTLDDIKQINDLCDDACEAAVPWDATAIKVGLIASKINTLKNYWIIVDVCRTDRLNSLCQLPIRAIA